MQLRGRTTGAPETRRNQTDHLPYNPITDAPLKKKRIGKRSKQRSQINLGDKRKNKFQNRRYPYESHTKKKHPSWPKNQADRTTREETCFTTQGDIEEGKEGLILLKGRIKRKKKSTEKVQTTQQSNGQVKKAQSRIKKLGFSKKGEAGEKPGSGLSYGSEKGHLILRHKNQKEDYHTEISNSGGRFGQIMQEERGDEVTFQKWTQNKGNEKKRKEKESLRKKCSRPKLCHRSKRSPAAEGKKKLSRKQS